MIQNSFFFLQKTLHDFTNACARLVLLKIRTNNETIMLVYSPTKWKTAINSKFQQARNKYMFMFTKE